MKLQIAGHSDGYDSIVERGDLARGRSGATDDFVGNRLLAVDAVNAPRDFMVVKMALMKGKTLDKAALSDCDDEGLDDEGLKAAIH